MPDALLPTFRDPEGSLVLQGEVAVRRVRPHAREATLRLLEAPFYQRAVERGDIVATTVIDDPDVLQLHHPRIPVPTYPWEWTPTQWLRAAELTLQLCEEALPDGRILKDATPLNILFLGPRPVLVDVLSFDRHDPGDPIWLAYGQFVRTFLLPVLMNKLLHWPLALSLFRRDGYEPAELYPLLNWRRRLSPVALWPITLPTWMESRAKSSTPAAPKVSKDPELVTHTLCNTLKSLRRRMQGAMPRFSASSWSEYGGTLTHYTPEQSVAKQQWVRAVAESTRPARALDIGANTGEYSALLARAGVEVVALERDGAAAERIFRMAEAEKLPVQVIHADFARPTPAAGWQNAESSALLPRLAGPIDEGQFDLILMLAVIHHLVLLDQIPLASIVALLHRLTRRHLIVEWVPPTDPMFQDLMRGREDLYGNLAEADLLAACAGLFQVTQQQTIGNGRTLFLFEKLS